MSFERRMSHTADRRIELFQPRLEALPSGGSVYNRCLVEAAQARGIALSLRIAAASEIERHFREHSTRLRIWDSLFIEALATQDLSAATDWGLLLHYLPSEDPALDELDRTRLSAIERRVVEAAPLVIVTGQALLAPVGQYRVRRPVRVSEPGVSPPFLTRRERRTDGSRQTIELLTVANMLPGKGLLDLLGALAALRDLSWRWHIVGAETIDLDYTRRFSSRATQLALGARIHRYGPLEQNAIAELMNRADIFVFASRFEAYGMALAEAAAAGLPAVTTLVGAAQRIYSHGSSGFLVPAGDRGGFADCLRELMTDADVRKRFRENLFARSPRTWQDTLDDFLKAVSAVR